METIKVLKKGILISAAAFLIACGGGGGGGGVAYSGKTTQAKISADNASELIGASIGGTDTAGSGSASITGDGADSKQGRSRTIGVGRGLTRATRSASANHQGGSGSSTAAPILEDTTEPGECGGEAVITGTWDDEIFDVDLTVTFNDYCFDGATPEEGSILNGVVTITGTEDRAAGSFNWTQTFTNLSFKDKTDSMTLNGSIAAAGTDTSFSVDMSYDFTDHIAGKTYRVENYKVRINEYLGSYITATVSGKVYHPDYGSYTISTNPALIIYYADDYPTSGTVRIDGADDTYASAEYHADGKYTLTIFDGVTTIIKTCDSITGVCTDVAP